MAELVITTFLTLDGVMQAPGGPTEDLSGGFTYGGWTVPFSDDDGNKIVLDIYSKARAFLLGRTTYDIFAGYWPKVTDPNDPIATALNMLPKFVASRTKTVFEWNNSKLVRDVVKEVPELKKSLAGDILVPGSGNLAQTLIANDLVDEYKLFIYPVIIGKGKRLFGSGTFPTRFKMVDTHTTPSGVVYSDYRRGGEFTTGSFDLPE